MTDKHKYKVHITSQNKVFVHLKFILSVASLKRICKHHVY